MMVIFWWCRCDQGGTRRRAAVGVCGGRRGLTGAVRAGGGGIWTLDRPAFSGLRNLRFLRCFLQS